MKPPGFARATTVLAGKDLLLEWSTWESLSAGLVFSLIVLVIFNFAFGFAAARELGVERLVPGVVWIVIAFAAVVGMTRSMQVERQRGTLSAVFMAPIDRGAIFLGKTLANLIKLTILQLLIVPLSALFFDSNLVAVAPQMLLVLVLHGIGLTSLGTLFAAVASRVGRGEALLATLLFPAASPLFISAVKSTASLLEGKGLAPAQDWLLITAGFDVLYVLVALSTFEFVLKSDPSMNKIVDRLTLVLLVLLTPAMIAALYMVFLYAPDEKVMGAAQRIFYFHVPTAMMTYLSVCVLLAGSIAYLWTRRTEWDNLSRAATETGLLFCTLVLITGPIWAKPAWGTWWTWEARLTTTLILWLLLLGCLMVRSYADNRELGGRLAAIVGIAAALDIPIIHKAVEWWRGQHPVVFAPDKGGALDPRMSQTFGFCVVVFLVLFLTLLAVRYRVANLEERSEQIAERMTAR